MCFTPMIEKPHSCLSIKSISVNQAIIVYGFIVKDICLLRESL